jgi:hypothetical protein
MKSDTGLVCLTLSREVSGFCLSGVSFHVETSNVYCMIVQVAVQLAMGFLIRTVKLNQLQDVLLGGTPALTLLEWIP